MFLPKIKQLRLENGLTVVQAAAGLGMSLSGYRRLENGQRRRIPLPLLWRIAQFYQISFEDLIEEAFEVIKRNNQ